MSDYLAEANAYGDRVEQLLAEEPDIRVVCCTAIHNGWDDGVIIACGETQHTIVVRIAKPYGMKEMDIESQVKFAIPAIRAREASRLADIEAVQSTVARFYV